MTSQLVGGGGAAGGKQHLAVDRRFSLRSSSDGAKSRVSFQLFLIMIFSRYNEPLRCCCRRRSTYVLPVIFH